VLREFEVGPTGTFDLETAPSRPGGPVHVHRLDGDLVAVRTARGTDAGLAASVWLVPSGAGRQLQSIALLDPSCAGTDVSVAVRTRATW
jgi:hypothetical protein